MKKQRLANYLTILFLLSLTSCAKSPDSSHAETISSVTETSATASETTKLSTSFTEETSVSSTAETTIPEESISNAEYWDIDPDADWCKAYAKYIEENYNNKNNEYIGDRLGYTLIYLDDNDIPELFIAFETEAGGEMAVSYHDGKLSEYQFSRHFSEYIERSGYVYTHTGNMGWYPMQITKLDNGVFTPVLSGVSYITEEEQEKWNNGEEWSYTYELEGKTVTKEEFDRQVNSFMDVESAIMPENYYSLYEILNLLKTGHWMSYDHRYEVILQDVTWIEAQKICQEKGGYLATVTCSDEARAISQLISDHGDDVFWYVGYISFMRNTPLEGQYEYSGWYEGDKHVSFDNTYDNLLYYFDPKYDSKNPEWDILEQNCGAALNNKDENKVYIYNIPYNVVERSSKYSGKVGFICEYNS